jgi:hypothetical protein
MHLFTLLLCGPNTLADDGLGSTLPSPALNSPIIDDILVRHHPAANKADAQFNFDAYNNMRYPKQRPKPLDSSHKSGPSFSPYAHQLDFEIAEFALDAQLNEHLIDRLIALMRKAEDGKEVMTFSNAKALKRVMSLASTKLCKVIKATTFGN